MGDILWSGVKTLLHFDNTPGSNAFLDEVPGVIWNNSGSPVISASNKFDVGSGLFGSNGYISSEVKPFFGVGENTDYTLEFWFKVVSWNAGDHAMLCLDFENIQFAAQADGSFMHFFWEVYFNNWSTFSVVSSILTSDTNWHHIAITREFNTTRMFVDGVIAGSTNNPMAIHQTYRTYIGTRSEASVVPAGQWLLDDFRVTIGAARYTEYFLIPGSEAEGPPIPLPSGWPYIEGYTTEETVPRSRLVRVYSKNTGKLLASTFSDLTGHFKIDVPTGEEVYAVVLDNPLSTRINASIISKIIPY